MAKEDAASYLQVRRELLAVWERNVRNTALSLALNAPLEADRGRRGLRQREAEVRFSGSIGVCLDV